ncbi:MAG: YeeE/YedE family protein [Planktomarina sp.]
MLEYIGDTYAAALVGLIGGLALGLAAHIGRFCTLGAIEDLLYGDDDRRLRMWAVAIGIGILGTYGLQAAGLFDTADSLYLRFEWNPIATIIGGLLFGYGMALSGNCGYGALARLGGGDLRSFVIVLVMGLSAYATMSGPLAPLRVWLFPNEPITDTVYSIPSLFEAFSIPTMVTAAILGAGIVAFALSSARFRNDRKMVFWGIVVGLAVISGWAGTAWIANSGFGTEPVVTHTFSAPLGDTMFYIMTASGNTPSFAVGSVIGVLAGAALGSYSNGHFRWEACEDPRELKRQILGAAIMGPGAVLALGCSVGQGISAFTTLAFSAPVAMAAIFIGAAFGLRQLIAGFGAID